MISEAAYFWLKSAAYSMERCKDQRCMRAALPPDRQAQDFL
jgi:hypothetical protein